MITGGAVTSHWAGILLRMVVLIIGTLFSLWLTLLFTEGDYRFGIIAFCLFFAVPFCALGYKWLEVMTVPASILLGGMAYFYNLAPIHAILGGYLAGWMTANFFDLRFIKEPKMPPLLPAIAFLTLNGILIFHFIDKYLQIYGQSEVGGLKLGLASVLTVFLGIKLWLFGYSSDHMRHVAVAGIPIGFFLLSTELLAIYSPTLSPWARAIYEFNWEVSWFNQGLLKEVMRIASLNQIGLYLALLGTCYITKKNALRFSGLCLFFLAFAGVGLCIASGYRTAFVSTAAVVFLGLWIRLRKLMFFPSLIGVCALIFICAGQGSLFDLPVPVQRALSVLPGRWSQEALRTTEGGHEWRLKLWKKYLDQIDYSRIWIGRGQYIAPESYNIVNVQLQQQSEEDSLQFFVDIQAMHSGVLTALDVAGILGLASLVLLFAYGVYISARMVIRNPDMPPHHLWLVLFYLMPWPLFWYTGGFAGFAPRLVIPLLFLWIAYRDETMKPLEQKKSKQVHENELFQN
jgi:hypothetical protein